MVIKQQRTVLVSPLNWGLGHASRCVPIIHELIRCDCKIIIVAHGSSLQFLKKEFKHLRYYDIPDYGIHYIHQKLSVFWAIIFQLPKIYVGIYKENQAIKKIILKEKVDIIISDNRYGIRSKYIKKNILITHQVNIQTQFLEKFAQKYVRKLMTKFDVCWIPDFENPKNKLAGTLSDYSVEIAHKIKYIGPLSRFIFSKESVNKNNYFITAIVSGPEPHKSEFSSLLKKHLLSLNVPCCIIEGKIEDEYYEYQIDTLKIYSFLDGDLLKNIMLTSTYIISRPGYSTIMDLHFLQKNAVLVPTPGQTEQEYLGKFHHLKKHVCLNQDSLNKENILKATEILSKKNCEYEILKEEPLQKIIYSLLSD